MTYNDNTWRRKGKTWYDSYNSVMVPPQYLVWPPSSFYIPHVNKPMLLLLYILLKIEASFLLKSPPEVANINKKSHRVSQPRGYLNPALNLEQ